MYYRNKNPDIEAGNLEVISSGFRFLAEANNNYGPAYGIYTAQGSDMTMYTNALKSCRTGADTGELDDIMNPNKNNFIEFDCR